MSVERGGPSGEESKKYFVKGGIAVAIGVFCFLGSVPVGIVLMAVGAYEIVKGAKVSKSNKK